MLENVYCGRYCKDKIYVQYIDTSVDPEKNALPQLALYEYSFETKERRLIYDTTNIKAERVLKAISQDHLVFREYERGDDGQDLYQHLFAINLSTGEETFLRDENKEQ